MLFSTNHILLNKVKMLYNYNGVTCLVLLFKLFKKPCVKMHNFI